jgi:hypothetical protein
MDKGSLNNKERIKERKESGERARKGKAKIKGGTREVQQQAVRER